MVINCFCSSCERCQINNFYTESPNNSLWKHIRKSVCCVQEKKFYVFFQYLLVHLFCYTTAQNVKTIPLTELLWHMLIAYQIFHMFVLYFRMLTHVFSFSPDSKLFSYFKHCSVTNFIFIETFEIFHTLSNYIKYENVGYLVLEHTVILRKYNTYNCLIDKNEKN